MIVAVNRPAESGVKVNRIANLDADLALAMKARSIRIVAPIPGKGAVGVEIPNPKPEMVYLREILKDLQPQGALAGHHLQVDTELAGRDAAFLKTALLTAAEYEALWEQIAAADEKSDSREKVMLDRIGRILELDNSNKLTKDN